MKKSEYILKSFINAGGTFAYVAGIAWFFSHIQNIFDGSRPDSFLAPIFMLLLFIISASVTSFLVFGKPIMMYVGGLKKESIVLLFATLAWLVVFVLIIALTLI